MTETEWLTCDEPTQMLMLIHNRVSKRKLRLFTVAGVSRISHLLGFAALSDALDMAEQFADGWASHEDLQRARDAAVAAITAIDYEPNHGRLSLTSYPALAAAAVICTCHADINQGIMPALDFTNRAVTVHSGDFAFSYPENAAQCALIRDISGNPFSPAAVDPRWITPEVVAIAQASYDAHAFDRLPILADALEEAGCDNDAVLAHCRGGGPHVRGCWVVDLILGKE